MSAPTQHPPRRRVGASLPDFPWDSLAAAKARAAAHPGGIVDLSVGTPVDATPAVVADALRSAADAPGYPQTHGTPALRETVASWFARRRGVPGLDPDGVLPTVGSKELVAWLPLLLGLGDGDVVAHPAVAYPTYDVGARLAGATPLGADTVEELDAAWEAGRRVRLLWLNSPSNPTGAVRSVGELAALVDWARARDVVVASDECYAELGWDAAHDTTRGGLVPSVLDPRVCGGDHTGLLVAYSTSKQSNLAGYRAAFLAGDVALVRELLELRKHAGMIVPWPVQVALRAALGDDEHVAAQRERYRARREVLRPALERAGFRVDASAAGLYLWSTRGEPCRTTIDLLAERGVLAAPGDFYGPPGARHVRIALTATDERIGEVPARLADLA
ncbi:succinyldiaminopimelate transaminase [Kineococcus radiotolerans]|uniref:Aminotransferase n=1 Tax=Kineococcus radiotolerans (strain ATCC BAA-149 / DSM 14245 / SRS30216) TaxID=266940 RepID=A6W738_KINRD|nr:succinyldiaminopimelate transaminase [Kineococcus radiotolerans]ABS02627.1 aminotransferase class I and II [Kineococcus radiotolerans SRS30216 = ATCC BAA-149]